MHSLEPPFSELTHHLLRAYDGRVSHRFLELLKYKDASYTSWYIRSGSVRLTFPSGTCEAGPGHWIFFDPFSIRSHRFEPGSRIVSIAHQIQWRGGLTPYPLHATRIRKESACPLLLEAADSLARASMDADPLSCPDQCRLQSAFYAWLGQWHTLRRNESSRAASPRLPVDPRIHTALALLGRNPGLGVIDYGRLEEALRLSRSQIDRLFRRHLGISPRQWCQQQALAFAQQALLASNQSVKEIAATLRFCDASHFAKWFRSLTGRSPSQLRTGADP